MAQDTTVQLLPVQVQLPATADALMQLHNTMCIEDEQDCPSCDAIIDPYDLCARHQLRATQKSQLQAMASGLEDHEWSLQLRAMS
jgi:hypothetical protein